MNNRSQGNKSNSDTTFKAPGFEFSGPAWLGLIFIIFCLILLLLTIQKKDTSEKPMIIKPVTKNVETSMEDPCNADIPWQEQPLFCEN